ncbi:MAG: hypothetical protein JNM56_08725 [Planctomycetia bacterium]|nr:hypothetical protein [Planctomycetia bacterium]
MPIDELLKKEIKAAKKTPRNFALVVSAKPGLIVSRTKIGGAAVKTKQKECGGGTVLRGRCFGEDGLLVFETVTKPAGGLAAKLKQLVKKTTGLTLNVELRQKDKVEEVELTPEVEDEVDDDEPGESEEPDESEEPTGDNKELAVKLLAALKERLKSLLPRILEAKRYAPDREDDLDELAQKATGYARAGNETEMLQALQALHDLCNTIWKAGPQDHPTTVLKQRLRTMLPGYQLAVEAQPDSKAELDDLIAQATKSAKAGRLEDMLNLLDNLDAAVQTAVDTGGSGETDSGRAIDHYDKRFAALQSSYDTALELATANGDGQAEELKRQRAKVEQLRADGDLAGALEELDALAGRVQSYLRSSGAGREVREAVGAGLVKTRPILLLWNRALVAARAAIDRLVSETLSHPDVVKDPGFPEIAERVRAYPEALPDFGIKLEAALELLQRSKPEERARALRRAVRVMENYRAKIDEVALLRQLEDSKFGKFRIHAELADALRQMKEMLPE